MVAKLDRQLNVNGNIFSFKQFIDNPGNYLSIIESVVRPSTMIQKHGESTSQFLDRLFCLLYYKKKMSVTNTNVNSHRCEYVEIDDGCSILNALGIDVIKHNPKISKVIFKNSGNTYRMKNSDMDILINSIKKNTTYSRVNIPVLIGVELEFVGIRDNLALSRFNCEMQNLVGADRYEHPLCYNHNSGEKWVLGCDGSVMRTYSFTEVGYELTSPKLNPMNSKDMNELNNVIELIQRILGGYTTKNCGTHIHMSFRVPSGYEVSKEMCAHFAKAYSNCEDSLFDKLVPLRRRGDRSRWCRATTPYDMDSRYHKLNLKNAVMKSSRLHLEFRQLDGTLEFEKIFSWIKLQKLFVELTMNSFKPNVTIEEDTVDQINLEEVVIDKSFNSNNVEALLKMSKMIA